MLQAVDQQQADTETPWTYVKMWPWQNGRPIQINIDSKIWLSLLDHYGWKSTDLCNPLQLVQSGHALDQVLCLN